MIVSGILDYDKKRKEIVLDDGEASFLLYAGEVRTLGLREEQELSQDAYNKIVETILKPRAKKRVLYYLKNGDKTRWQITEKLRQSRYPQEVIDDTLAFLEQYRFADDQGYAERYVEELRGRYSEREIRQRLYRRGIDRETAREAILAANLPEDEYAACERVLRSRLAGKGCSDCVPTSPLAKDEKRRLYAYLARKGFSYDAIEAAFARVSENVRL